MVELWSVNEISCDSLHSLIWNCNRKQFAVCLTRYLTDPGVPESYLHDAKYSMITSISSTQNKPVDGTNSSYFKWVNHVPFGNLLASFVLLC